MQFGFGFRRDEAGVGGEAFCRNPHQRLWMGSQILHPFRGRVFGDHVETSVAIREPDLDLAGQASRAASSGEIEILLVVETIVL